MDTARDQDVARSKEGAIYRGCVFTVDELEIAARVIAAEIKTLRENFTAEKPVSVKLAAEQINKTAGQIAALSKVLSHQFSAYLSRRPR